MTSQSNQRSISGDHIEINSKNIIIFMYDPYFCGIFPISTLRTHHILAKLKILQSTFSIYLQRATVCITVLLLFSDFKESLLRSSFFVLSCVLLLGYVYVRDASSIGLYVHSLMEGTLCALGINRVRDKF